MDYQFFRALHERNIHSEMILNCQDCVDGMLEHAKGKLDGFHKYYFGNLNKGMRCFEEHFNKKGRYYKKYEEEIEIKQYLPRNPVSLNQCIFTVFLLIECGIMPEANYIDPADENYYPYVDIFNALLSSIKKDTLINDCMDSAILFFCLASEQKWTFWVDWQSKWNEEREKYHETIPEEWPVITYRELCEQIEQGLQNTNDIKATRKSFQEVDRQISERIGSYKEKSCKANDISRIFSDDIISVLERAEKRRRWYLLRLLSFIIDKQIDNCIERFNIYKKSLQTQRDMNQLKAVFRTCWLSSMNDGKTLMNLDRRDLQNMTEEDLREFLMNLSVKKLESVANAFVDCFSVERPDIGLDRVNILALAKHRYIYHYFYCKNNDTDYDDFVDNPYMKQEYLGTEDTRELLENNNIDEFNEYFENIFEEIEIEREERIDRDERIQPEGFTETRPARTLERLFIGRVRVTREMILLFVLFAKSQRCEKVTDEYVSNLLYNCRFETDINTDNGNLFNYFYVCSMKEIEYVAQNAMDMEREYLLDLKGAVFYDITRGREIY